jgi:hypothetical protein
MVEDELGVFDLQVGWNSGLGGGFGDSGRHDSWRLIGS